MAQTPQAFGLVGLGIIGGNLGKQAVEKGFRVLGYKRSEWPEHLRQSGIENAGDYEGFRDQLPSPRIVFIYIPTGKAVDKVIDRLCQVLEPGDIIVDGGNSYWGDSIKRAERVADKGLHFIDCGTSGGSAGARNGACFMAGGEEEAFRQVEPILRKLAVPDGYVYCGPAGSGHFVKLVHNGIEFGMLQAIAEGMHLLKKYRSELPVPAILHTWNHGSVIRSWLVELMEKQLGEQGGLEAVPAFVDDTGEVNWLVTDAMQMDVPVPVIAQSVMQLIASRDQDGFAHRAIALMRHGFGEHPFGADEKIEKERHHGKQNPYPEA